MPLQPESPLASDELSPRFVISSPMLNSIGRAVESTEDEIEHSEHDQIVTEQD
jgi:hypothetical protein